MKIVRESISFERGKDPRETMSIGVKGQIKKYFEEEDYETPSYEVINKILEDDDLERETKESWINYLLKTDPNEYTFEDPELYWFNEWDYDYLDPLPEGYSKDFGGIEVLKHNGKWFVVINDMASLADLFDTHRRDISKENIEKVLSGDAWDLFEIYGSEDSDVKDFLESKWNQIETGYLIDLYHYAGGEGETEEEIIEDVFENDEFESLKDAIKFAFDEALTSSYESEAFNHMKKEVLNHYDMGEPQWDPDREHYRIPITKEGVRKIFNHSFLGDDGLEYYEPYGGYVPDIDIAVFDEALERKLSDL